MPVSSDTRQALRLLERIQLHLKESNAAQINPSIGEDLNTLISVLDSPVFNSILNIQDSLQELKKQLHKHPSILPVDFDISPATGELILNVSSDPIPLQNSDSYEPSSDPEQNYEFDNQISAARMAIKQEGIDNEGLELSASMAAPPDYALSAITTDSYAEEFQKTIDQGAQGREIHTLQLFKPEGSSLGFSVVGLRSEQKGELGIFIQEIQQNGIAGRDGHLQEGDQILAIDGQPLDSNISHQQAISILQQARGLVELIVARGGIPVTSVAPSSTDHPAPVSLERSPSAVSAGSKTSDMVLNTEWAQVESIDLINDGAGLGFGIIGGRSTGVVVKTILPGGVADRDGRLRSGDHILQIGDVNLRGMGSEQVAMVLRQSGSHVRLIVARPVDPTSSDFCALQSSAPIVPTRILADPEEVEKHLVMFQQTQNGFPEPIPYKGPPDVDASFIYQRELNGTEEFYDGSFLPSSFSASQFERIAEQEAGGDLPEMEAFEVELVKDQQGLGITVAGYICEKEGISGIFVKSIAKGSAADLCGMIRVNDQIIEVDGRSLHGYTNHQAVEVLRNAGKIVKLRLARYLRGVKYEQLQKAIASGELSYTAPPVIPAQVHDNKSSLIAEASNRDVDIPDSCLPIDDRYADPLDPMCEAALQAKWSKVMGPDYEIVVSQIIKFREGGGLGISLEGTVDVEDGKEVRPHHYIRSILADGPVGVNGRLHGGDELLEVNGVKLLGMNHHGVVATLKELPMYVRMVCARRLLPTERDVAPSVSEIDYSHPYHMMDYDLSTVPEFPDRGNLSGPFGGSLTSLTPVSERLVKAKSDGSLAIGTSASSSPPMEVTLSKLKSRSLEPLTGLAMWSSEPQIIELIKGDRGLGFSILDYQDPMNPNETVIVIRSLVPGGVAQQDGRLIPGDRLLFVNDINLENASLDAAVQALKGASKGVVRIGVAKPLPLPESSQSGQNLVESGSGILELTRKSSFEFPVSCISSYCLESEQISSTQHPDDNIHEPQLLPSTAEIRKRSVSLFPEALERTMRIKKGGDILGLAVDILDSIGGAVVSSIAPLSAAEKDGRIEPGDFLLSLNGRSLVNVTEEEASQILYAAEKINTDVVVKYIPAADAAVHHQSALMSLDRHPELPVQTLKSPIPKWTTTERVFSKLEREGTLDTSEMVPPTSPPPPPPPPPSRSLTQPSTAIENQESEMSKQVTKNSIFDSTSILVLKREEDAMPTTDRAASVSTFKPFKAVVRTPPVFEERKSLLSANITKPAVPLKPLRPSLLTHLDILGKEKSKVSSTLEGLIGDMSPSSLSRQWGPERSVELNRDPSKGLGISIISGKLDASQSGIFVKNVLSDSPAGWNGTLKRGDRILEVGGIDLRSATHSKAVEVIKNAQNPVKFVVQSLVPVPKKIEGDVFSPEIKLSKISRPDFTRDAPESSPRLSWSSTLLEPSSFDKVPLPPLTVGSSPERGQKPEGDKEPPVPPPRTVSRMPKSPSEALDSADTEENFGDQVSSSNLSQGKVLTKKGVEIDLGSAGNVRLSPSEAAGDAEDEFGYTASKPFAYF